MLEDALEVETVVLPDQMNLFATFGCTPWPRARRAHTDGPTWFADHVPSNSDRCQLVWSISEYVFKALHTMRQVANTFHS